MEYISPIKKTNNKNNVVIKQMELSAPKKSRATRSDKLHPIRFPIDKTLGQKLESKLKEYKRDFKIRNQEKKISQTDFNTQLLRFGLEHLDLVNWDKPYKDYKTSYMTTKLLETEYENYIGGPHGLTVQKQLFDRRVVYFIIVSILEWLERGGSIEKVFK